MLAYSTVSINLISNSILSISAVFIMISITLEMQSLVQQVQMYLREAALVVQYAQYPMRLSSDEVETGLVVAEGLLLPLDLLPHVLLLHTQHKSSSGWCI